MTDFKNAVDIANRALQHCGSERIDAAQGFAEDSKRARECAFAYPKLRQAELQRNVWAFAIKRAVLRPLDTSTMLLSPSLWSSLTTYFVGSIVVDDTGVPWISRIPNNLGNDPNNTTAWDQYFGPMAVMLYATGGSYFSGELVYTSAGDGTARVYLSLQDSNSDNPATPTAWSATDTYHKNQVVTASAIAYMSRIDFNTNQTPSTHAAADWASGTTYAATNKVTGSDGITYQSIGNGNIGHDPTLDVLSTYWTNLGVLTAWTTTFVGGAGSLKWLQIGGAEFPMGVTLTPINTIYPVGAGPSSQSTTRNVFRLPAGFLRKAPTDPKAGSTSYLGASWGLNYADWNFEGSYITSSQFDPIMLRFVADTVDVQAMDPMFCEGLAARVAIAVCEPLTQSGTKLASIAGEYQKFMTEARTVNAILTGAEEPPVDDYIACRA